MVLRGFAMDNVRWWCRYGRHHAGRCHVPSLALDAEAGSVVPQHSGPSFDRCFLRDRDRSVNILHHHCGGYAARDLDLSSTVC